MNVKNILQICGSIVIIVSIFIFLFYAREFVNKLREDNNSLRKRAEYFEKQFNDTAVKLLSVERVNLKLSQQLSIATNESFKAQVIAGYSIEQIGIINEGLRGAIQLNNRNWRIIESDIEYISRLQKRGRITN